MLTLLMFDAFSTCHSLSQTVMGVILFSFWLINQEYSFLEKFIKNRLYFLLFCSSFIFTVFKGNAVFPYQRMLIVLYCILSVRLLFYINFDCVFVYLFPYLSNTSLQCTIGPCFSVKEYRLQKNDLILVLYEMYGWHPGH